MTPGSGRVVTGFCCTRASLANLAPCRRLVDLCRRCAGTGLVAVDVGAMPCPSCSPLTEGDTR